MQRKNHTTSQDNKNYASQRKSSHVVIDRLMRAKRFTEAKEILDELLDVDPNDIASLVTRSGVFSILGLYDPALHDCNRVESLYQSKNCPTDLDWRNLNFINMAGIKCQQGKYTEAIETCNNLIEQDDDCSSAVHFIRAKAHFAQGNYKMLSWIINLY